MVTYEQLNDALCDALFTEEYANKPVYLELTEEVVDKVNKQLDLTDVDLEELIIDSVKQLLHLTGVNTDLFGAFVLKQLVWESNIKKSEKNSKISTNYPNLPLLMVFAITAAQMGTTGGFKTSAYYPRLKELIEVENKKLVEESYRSVAVSFWSGLNFWLDSFWKGQRGIGTAYSISNNRYIGFALAQALVRSVDRNKLPRLFRENGFSAFTSLVAKDMEKVIDEWAKKDYSEYNSKFRSPSKPFMDLWTKTEARTRMASILCRELESWDGKVSLTKSETTSLDINDYALRLELLLTTFPTKSLNIIFALSSPTEIKDNRIKILNSSSEKSTLQLNAQNDGWLRPNVNIFPISNEDLVTSVLQIDIGQEFKIERYPKNLIIFKFDELSRKYFETERLELGMKCLILAFESEGFVDRIRNVLMDASRSGWKELDSTQIPGIPNNWIMFSDVELLQSPKPELIQHTSLEALKPSFSGSLSFSQGLQLPGRPPKWHSKVPLEIKASVLGAESLQIGIINFVDGVENQIALKSFQSQTAIWNFDVNELSDGDYFVQLLKDGEPEEITEKLLRLRSSDTLDETAWHNKEKLIHDLSSHNSAVIQTSKIAQDTQFYIDGAAYYLNGDFHMGRDQHQEVEVDSWWSKANKENVKKALQQNLELQKVEVKGCFVNGAHNFELPMAPPSRTRNNLQRSPSNFIDGICKYCGIRKKFAATPWAAERKKVINKNVVATQRVEQILSRVNISSFPSIEANKISWNILLDSIMHMGGGNFSSLESIANNIDTSALFKYEFINHLDQLAIIDMEYDDYFEMVSWEVSPKCIVTTLDGFFLTGYWSHNEWINIQHIFGKNRAIEEIGTQTFSRKMLINVNEEELVNINNSGIEYSLVDNACTNILKMLPTISAAISDLPMKPLLGFEVAERFIPEINSWVETEDLYSVGGYRLTHEYRRRYIVRNQSDIENRTVRYCNPEISKHFASSQFGKPLFFYIREKKQLICPLGARLPGLYGRALVLASGTMPDSDTTGKYVIYNNISGEQAKMLSYKLGQNK
jgi:hypothetical protein